MVYDILKKKEEGDLKDRSRAPLHSPYKTPEKIEDKVPYGPIRQILRRNKTKLTYTSKGRKKAEKREFVDWYSAKPFQVVQVDLKFIRDRKALIKEQIIHLDYYGIPNYLWGLSRLTPASN